MPSSEESRDAAAEMTETMFENRARESEARTGCVPRACCRQDSERRGERGRRAEAEKEQEEAKERPMKEEESNEPASQFFKPNFGIILNY